jgi:long-chain fatty acid transport protein
MTLRKTLIATTVAAALAPITSYATIGMNLEGYGPISTAMGGAALAYDNGLAAVMSNPATLGLMDEGRRLDVALGNMRPTVKAKMGSTTWESTDGSFLMPALGYAEKRGNMTWGVAGMAQGGMGADYSALSPGGAASMQHTSNMADAFNVTSVNKAYATGEAAKLQERSELSVGRILFPFAWRIDNQLTIGGSIDYVWASLDLKMAMPGNQMQTMMGNNLIRGSMVNAMMGMMDMTGGSDNTKPLKALNYGYFDFSDDKDYTGSALGAGFAAKIGMTFRVDNKLTIGATYHSQTAMSDLESDTAKVTMMVVANMGSGNQAVPMDLYGTLKVKDFQWPSTFGIGLSYQHDERLQLVADLKLVGWAAVMKQFDMSFTASSDARNNLMNGAMDMRGQTLDATLPQEWDDQVVVSLGGAYKLNETTMLRAGFTRAKTPTQESTINHLFPAVTQSHYTFGAGFALANNDSIDVSLAIAPEVQQTHKSSGMTSSMSQTNLQVMYSKSF